MFPSASKVNRKYARIPNEYDCGCLIVADDASGYFIHACDKHNAAPDLLEACEAALFYAQEHMPALHDDDGWKLHQKLVDQLDAAIAKARGGE